MDRIDAANEVAFRVGFSGYSGHLRLEPLPPVERPDPLRSLPDFILPSAFELEKPETLRKVLEQKYLVPELDPQEFSAESSGRQWDFDWFDRTKIHREPSLPRSVVVPTWDLPFRRLKGGAVEEKWKPTSLQIDVKELMEGAQLSGSLPRMPGPSKDFVKGGISNRPFHPGGLENTQNLERTVPEGARNGDWICELLDGGVAQAILPSLKQGIDFGHLKGYPYLWKIADEQSSLECSSSENLSMLSVHFDDLFKKEWKESVDREAGDNSSSETESVSVEQEVVKEESVVDGVQDTGSSPVDEILSEEAGLLTKETDDAGKDHGAEHKETWATSGSSERIADHFYELVPDMALEFPFELDTFQKEAIYYLEKGDSVFVAAHTSAGKTVVAEYAFALATKHCTRAVYTAPIKTISNQKYRDFCGKFDVGLLTGDVSLRPEASCLIMTTEILRSMLYRGADIIRDIEWVIFDEVHYVNDAERGVVWEEVIIMLPRHINIVLLSATVPNTVEFADWIGRTKQKKIRVTGTTKRPVPLEHYLFYSGELYEVCGQEFEPQGVRAAKIAFKKKNSSPAGGSLAASQGSRASLGQARQLENHNHGKLQKHSAPQPAGKSSLAGRPYRNNWGSKRAEASFWLSLVNKLSKFSLLPVVIFCFSKNRCDKSGDNMPGTDLTTSSEKSEIRVFCDKAFSRLKGSDKNLPQIVRVRNLLLRGIGVHHAGLLPIVKEVVEMLFCRGVIKVLFSTETFAMGVNAPARTVVFDTLRKFDGKEFRQLLPGEYTQMAGRAGRRGLDKIGTVIVMCRDEIPEEKDLRHIMVGSPTRLESQFRLTYTMILHLLRVEELKVEDMLKRSFAEFHAQKKLPEKQQLLMRKLAQTTKTIECIKGEPAIEEYYEMFTKAERHQDTVLERVMLSNAAQHCLSPGRVVVVKSQSVQDHLLGVILKAPSTNFKQFIVLVLKPESPPSAQKSSNVPGKQQEEDGYFMIIPKAQRNIEYYSAIGARKGSGAIKIQLPHSGQAAGVNFEVRGMDAKDFLSICKSKIKIDQVRLLEEPSDSAYSRTVQLLLDEKTDGNRYPPALHPLDDLKLRDMHVVEEYDRWNDLLQKMSQNKCHGCIRLQENITLVKELNRHRDEVDMLKYQMSDEALQQMPDFQGRIDVLKAIGCIDAELVVQIKGRVACEMNSGEELICTECLFENQLDDLEPAEAIALMSALVFQQKNTEERHLTPKLARAKQRLYDTAVRLAELQASFNVSVNPEDYVADNLKFGLVEVVYEWAKGTPFADICELTDVPEGLIVRTIVRLDETCREFKNAAAIMGNSALYKKMEQASNAIKRDIVFAASLYITGV